MLITQDTQSFGEYHIRAYDSSSITVNDTRYTRSFLLAPHRLIPDWPPDSLETLEAEHLNAVLSLKMKILILGTGQRFKMPSPKLLKFFMDHHFSVEYMDTHAACRTYIALTSEGRSVAAALIIERECSR